MFTPSLHRLPCLYNYEKAHTYFTKTSRPPRSQRWAENQRPLKDVRSHHYRIETGRDNIGHYYDLMLYSTAMARYYEPTIVDGKQHERRMYRNYPSTTSAQFLLSVVDFRRQQSVPTTDGYHCIAPVYTKTLPDSRFSLDAVFIDGKLDVANSRHTPHYKYVSNDDDKQRRAVMRERLNVYVMLAVLRMPEFEQNAQITDERGRPFGGSSKRFSMRESVRAIVDGRETEKAVQEFFHLAQDVFSTLASKRAYEQVGFKLTNYWGTYKGDDYDKLEKKITQQEFEKVLRDNALKIAGAGRRSEPKELPQFMREEDYPKSNLYV